MKSKIVIIIFCLYASLLSAQDSTVYSYEEFLKRVEEHHPISMQQQFVLKRNDYVKQKAKGYFDPKLDANWIRKEYDGKTYYDELDAGLKIPTWFGITVEGGYENNVGDYLNPELETPSSGLVYAGVSINLLQGLLMDERRAALKQAEVYASMNENEQKILRNELLFDASKAYIKWLFTYQKLEIINESVDIAQNRLSFVKQMANLGDVPDIDTLKAHVRLQDRLLYQQQVLVEYKNAMKLLSTFMWQKGMLPLELEETTIPDVNESSTNQLIENTVTTVRDDHPFLQVYSNKLDVTRIENRLLKEYVKPDLNVKYNALQEYNEVMNDGYTIDNYKLGASFSYPIFTRKERAELNLSEIKINELEVNIANKSAELSYKVQASLNNYNSLVEQVSIYSKNAANYRALFKAENDMFRIGESSMFMVNRRDTERLEAELKLIQLQQDLNNAALEFKYWSFGF